MTAEDEDEILAAAREGFMAEAQDMLRQFEEGLLAMEQDPTDAEAMNSAFRAAHTIKGTAGLFGYEAVVLFTHEVESVLDLMRANELRLGDDAMAVLLQSRDQMGRLLHEIGAREADPEVARLSERLGAQLRSMRGAAPVDAHAPAAAVAETPVVEAPAGTAWHLSLRVGPDAMRNGLDPHSFIRYLETLGRVDGIRTLVEQVPALDTLDPEGCYLGFEIRLTSSAERRAIEQVFSFLMEDCTLVLLDPSAGERDYLALLDERAPTPEARTALQAHWQALCDGGCGPFWSRPDAAPRAPVAAATAAPAVSAMQSGPAPVPATLPATAPAAAAEAAAERRPAAKERRGEEARFIRVRADKLDRLIDLIGELVIASSGAQLVASQEHSPAFGEAALRIHDLVQEARDGALGLRMVPVGETFSRFHRIVRDVGKQLDKDVELSISGGETELDKSMVDTIADPLMHLVRNSLDHGIEPAAERQAAGKPAQGRLALHAYHESGAVVIEVTDDGRGLDRRRIRQKAVERGLISENAVLDDQQVDQLIFAPGFSTAEQVTNLSGRGVGMDVVKRNVEALRGKIRVTSQLGRGTTMQIRLPLTLAIIDGFLTQVGGVSYVLPLELVAECLEVPAECLEESDRIAGHFDLRGEVLPYLDVGRFYRHPPPRGGRRSLVLVRDGTSRVGLVVDRLLGEHQTVIKPLGEVFRHIRGLAGSTILGSGEVALVLDVPALLEHATTLLTRPTEATLQA